MEPKSHWENVYATKAATAVSWFQAHADLSLRLIAETGASTDASIIDVGGGAWTLVDDLLARGYTSLCVLDLSAAALNAARARLGRDAEQVRWIEGDITSIALPAHAYDLWHDRAVFHFMTDPEQRAGYLRSLDAAVAPGATIVVATFAPDGPERCSGLVVDRYDAEGLVAALTERIPARLLMARRQTHTTPWGATQAFTWVALRRN